MGIFDDEFLESPETGHDSEEFDEEELEETPEEGDEGPGEDDAGHPSEDDQDEPPKRKYANKYDTIEQLEEGYLHAQRKLSERDEEKEELRQRLQMLEQLILSQQQPQRQGYQGYQQQAAPEDLDAEPEDFLDQFYDDPVSVIDRRIERIIEQRLEQLNPTLNAVQQFMTEQFYLRKASELAAKYPDFQDMIPAIQELGRKYPQLAQDPNGMELAYQIAKGMHASKAQSQEENTANKKAARMPGSTGGTRRTERQATEEELILKSIFGNPKESGGIFD